MQYSFDEIHALNILSDDSLYSKHFTTPPDLKIMVLVIFLCFSAAITGAILFKVDKIVPAQGVINTKAELFEVRNTETGFIKKIFVREGDLVVKGQPLVQFETQLVDLDIDKLRQQLNNLSRNIWSDFYQIDSLVGTPTRDRLLNSLADVPNPILGLGYEQYFAKPFLDAKEVNRQARQSLSEQLVSTKKQRNNLAQRLSLQGQELDRIEQLYTQQIESKANLDQSKARVLSLESELESLVEASQSLESKRLSLEKEQEQSESTYVLERFVRIHDQLDTYQTTRYQLAQKERSRQDLNVTSPINGTIDALLIQGDKERIAEGTTLLSIRPSYTEQDLVIDIQIPASYAIWAQLGMTFRASSLGNNPEDHGYVMGEITFIAASSENDDKTSARVYRMKGRITEVKALRTNVHDALLRPGSVLSVEIRAGKRRLINYIFDPFTKYLRTALSEPS